MTEELKWQKEKPDYACVFLTRHNGNYELWRFSWEQGEPPEDATVEEEETRFYYLSWQTEDGDEWDEISECDFDEYLVLEKLSTMTEVHQQWIKSMTGGE